MAVKRVTKYGENVLNIKTKPIIFSEIKENLPNILQDMFDTCKALNGVGLSANQIGLNLRLAVIIIMENEQEKRFVLINPEIIDKKNQSVFFM